VPNQTTRWPLEECTNPVVDQIIGGGEGAKLATVETRGPAQRAQPNRAVVTGKTRNRISGHALGHRKGSAKSAFESGQHEIHGNRPVKTSMIPWLVIQRSPHTPAAGRRPFEVTEFELTVVGAQDRGGNSGAGGFQQLQDKA